MNVNPGMILRWHLFAANIDAERVDEITEFLTHTERGCIEEGFDEPRSYHQIVAEAGSVDMGAQGILDDIYTRANDPDMTLERAQELAGEIMQEIIATAPHQLNGIPILACQYHSLREIASRAMARRDLKTAITAHAEISKLLQTVA